MDGLIPNERLRRARSLKGWSQAELAAKIGTSFEMVSRWERGVTLPSPFYRERLSAVLGRTTAELGLTADSPSLVAAARSPIALLVSSHADAANPLVASLKLLLQDRGVTLISSGQLGRQGREHTRTALREAVPSALALLVILSPEARTSRHVREALDLAQVYQRPVYGLWIAGERWQECLPEESAERVTLIDARASTAPALVEEVAAGLQHAGLTPSATEAESAEMPAVTASVSSVSSAGPLPAAPASGQLVPFSSRIRKLSGKLRIRAPAFVGFVALVIMSVALAGSNGARDATSVRVDRGGIWLEDIQDSPQSFLPDGDPSGAGSAGALIEQALYLPLFYGDAKGLIHPGAATEVPTLRNGGISSDGATWTFHLRPHLLWSDGRPYDARDVDYTWKLWLDPAFGAFPANPGLSLISSAAVSADHLAITFHLKRAYAPFLQYWVGGFLAPLPVHHFSGMAPAAIQLSADNLDPIVTSGPFMVAESVPDDHFTLVRNPRYYLAGQGLPYLDKVVFRVTDAATTVNDLQTGAITATAGLDLRDLPAYQHLPGYRLVSAPTSGAFEALWFDFHNSILASHIEVRQAMAMAIDRQALVKVARRGFASPLCTDHPSAVHPGYGPAHLTDCPEFDLPAANRLLDDTGWVKGTDGVRAKDGQRLEFEYSTTTNQVWRDATQTIIQRDFMAIGIKLDVQDYSAHEFFGFVLPGGAASPPSGAVAGHFDIAEYAQDFNYDPDDSPLLGCGDQTPPYGGNWTFYCNPALDALYQQELTTVEPGRRQQIFGFIDNVYLTDLPLIILYAWSETDPAIARIGTHNYLPSPLEGSTIAIWSWWCDHGTCH